jgi:hypothetical protein
VRPLWQATPHQPSSPRERILMVFLTILYPRAASQSPPRRNGVRTACSALARTARARCVCLSRDGSLLHRRQRRAPSLLRPWPRQSAGGHACRRLRHLCATASWQRRPAARLSTEAGRRLALGPACLPWHGGFGPSLRHASRPLYAQSWDRRATTCWKPRPLLTGSRLLTWRSRRASRWTSGLVSSGARGRPDTGPQEISRATDAGR